MLTYNIRLAIARTAKTRHICLALVRVRPLAVPVYDADGYGYGYEDESCRSAIEMG